MSSNNNDIAEIEKKILAMAGAYLERRRQEFLELEKLLANKDLRSVARIGHKWRGNALNYGFASLGELGKELEEAAFANNFEATEIALNKVRLFLADPPNPQS